MEIKRTIEIFVRAKRRFVIQPTGAAEQVFCPHCAELMLAAETAAALLGLNRRSVYQLIENGAAHFVETADGAVLVCPASLNSITRQLEKG